jgi:hypothetical protein
MPQLIVEIMIVLSLYTTTVVAVWLFINHLENNMENLHRIRKLSYIKKTLLTLISIVASIVLIVNALNQLP